MEITQKVYCNYCDQKDGVTLTTKENKFAKTIKVSKCINCKIQNGIKAVLTDKRNLS